MKKRYPIICILILFLAEAALLTVFARKDGDFRQDTVAVNEIVKFVEANWEYLGEHTLPGDYPETYDCAMWIPP